MILRRAFFYALFGAVPVLPAWLLIGWGIFGHGGWEFLGLVIACPIVFVALLVVALLIYARPTVRKERAVSWWDVAVLTIWYGCLIAFGLFGDSATTFAVLGVLAALGAFWLALWELFSDGARTVRRTMDEFERQAQATGLREEPTVRRDDGDGDVIIVHEVKD